MLPLVGLLIMMSCDKEVIDEEAIAALEGHWHIWEYEPSADSPVDASILAKESILQLVEIGCDPIEFDFKDDRNVRYTDGMRYLDATFEEDGDVHVHCAPEYDKRDGKYKFDYEKLTIEYLDGEVVEFEAELVNDSKFVTTVNNMFINGVKVSGKLTFIRELDDH